MTDIRPAVALICRPGAPIRMTDLSFYRPTTSTKPREMKLKVCMLARHPHVIYRAYQKPPPLGRYKPKNALECCFFLSPNVKNDIFVSFSRKKSLLPQFVGRERKKKDFFINKSFFFLRSFLAVGRKCNSISATSIFVEEPNPTKGSKRFGPKCAPRWPKKPLSNEKIYILFSDATTTTTATTTRECITIGGWGE